MTKCKINVQLLPMKTQYFLSFAGLVSTIPFMIVYAKQLGFSGFVIGTVYGIMPFCKIFIIPLLGVVADKYKNQKTIFIIVQFVTACGFLGLIFLPALPKDHKVQFSCSSNGSIINIQGDIKCPEKLFGEMANNAITCEVRCPLGADVWNGLMDLNTNMFYVQFVPTELRHNHKQLQLPVSFINETKMVRYCANRTIVGLDCDIHCNLVALNEIISKPSVSGKDAYSYYHFWLLALIVFVCYNGYEVTVTFADTVCFQILGEKRYKFGSQRMFSALGFGIFGIIAGFLIDIYSSGSVTKNHTPSFAMAAGLLLLSAIVSCKIQYTQQPHKANIIKDVGQQLLSPHVTVFVLWCTAFGMYSGASWGFLFWLLEDLAAAHGCDTVSKIKRIEGISIALTNLVGELPFYFFSTWIFKRLSYINSMTLSLLLMGIQLLSYSLMSNPWWNLPISVLKGVVLGLCFSIWPIYASIVAPRGTETTTQGIASASVQVGSALGSFLGGVLLSIVGASNMFRIFGIAAIVLCILHAFVQCLIGKQTPDVEVELNSVNLI